MKLERPYMNEKEMQLIGEVSWLLLQSEVHRDYPLHVLESRFLNAIRMGQCRFFYDEQGPIGIVTWAQVTREWHEKLTDDDVWLPEVEWNRGNYLWFMDFVAPFGNCTAIRRSLSQQFSHKDQAWCRRLGAGTKADRVFKHRKGHVEHSGASYLN
ncbi:MULTISPECIES: toxin-activating lysine-acyltransferase [Vibrio]|uniref:toxin-activating lysine-acyltransferase n=1 Tax=Vibrio TaxID=662 RepID=UPI003D0FC065